MKFEDDLPKLSFWKIGRTDGGNITFAACVKKAFFNGEVRNVQVQLDDTTK